MTVKAAIIAISDLELAPKFMAPFIIFLFRLGSTVCGIFLQISAIGYPRIVLGAILVFAGPLGAFVCMWLWL
jgi:hypothetical protein